MIASQARGGTPASTTATGANRGPRVLVVDDDHDFSVYLSEVLQRAGAVPHAVHDGEAALAAASHSKPNLVLLDRGVAGADDAWLVEKLRYELSIPVVIVSGRASMAAIVDSLDHGADDYIVKPVRPPELVARIRAVLRRSTVAPAEAPPAQPDVLDFGDLVIDTVSTEVTVRGEPVSLTPRELALLVFLARHPHRSFSRRQILEEVWQSTPSTSAASTVNEHIRRLRNKLEQDPASPRWLLTCKGFGYRFEAGPVTAVA